MTDGTPSGPDTRASAPPSLPEHTLIRSESIDNYEWTNQPLNRAFSCTGLMAVVPLSSDDCYGDVEPGEVFLFPGIIANSLPPSYGYPTIKCAAHPALWRKRTAPTEPPLHAQMIALLGRQSTDYVGFSVSYPWTSLENIGYNSGTCNTYWFGSNRLPQQWQRLVNSAIANWLPS